MRGKRPLSLLLALLLACAAPLSPAAAEERQSFVCGDYSYALLPDGTAEIVGYTGTTVHELTLPAELDGYAVSGVGDSAFAECYSLTSVTFPESILHVGVNPFEHCDNLSRYLVPDGHPTLAAAGSALYSKADNRLICYPRTRSTPKSCEIPEGITAIGDRAFSWCFYVESITIPDSVTSIGEMAFFGCHALTSLAIPEGVTRIRSDCFYSCSAMTGITLPQSLTHIDDRAFYWCSALSDITLPAGLQRIGDEAFTCCDSLTEVVIPDGVTHIGEKAFQWCASLTSVTIPDSVTSIGDQVFLHSDLLTSVIVGRGSYAEKYCQYHDLPYAYPDSANWLSD